MMEQTEKEKKDLEKGKKDHQQKMAEIKSKLKETETQQASDDLAKLKLEMSELEKQEADFKKKEEELKKKERLTPWNVDTLCKDGKSRTIINKIKPPKKEDLTEEELADRQVKFQEKYEKDLKKFGMMRRYEDSEQLLTDNPHLVCEETANYLVIWCVNLEMEEKHDLMSHVSHQTIIMQFILELAKTMEVDARNCVRAFFSRIKKAEKQYQDAFNDELESFKHRVRTRAQAKLEAAMKEAEEEERQKRLGPGGLDPVEVYESLPAELQQCFDTKDVGMLQKVLTTMPREEAETHLKRCIDSGLWVANAKDAEGQASEDGATGGEADVDK